MIDNATLSLGCHITQHFLAIAAGLNSENLWRTAYPSSKGMPEVGCFRIAELCGYFVYGKV
jgi:hypothetical protein